MILTCPSCTARFVIPRSQDELRDVEVTHPACGHAFAPFASPSAVVAQTEEPEPVPLVSEELLVEEVAVPATAALEERSFEADAEACAADDDGEDDDASAGDDVAPSEIDTHSLRKELTQATTIPFRQLLPRLTAAGFAFAAAAELVFLFDQGSGAFPTAHFTLALLGMGR